MNTRTAALVVGVAFAVVGIVGFVPSPPLPDAPPLTVEHGHGMALGIFPVNTLHNIVHLIFAVLGLAAWGSGRNAGAMGIESMTRSSVLTGSDTRGSVATPATR